MPRRQRGVAMLVAILLVALGTILAATIAFNSAMAARRSTATMALDQSVLVAEAAEALAGYALREDFKAASGTSRVDYPGEEWAHPIGPVEVLPGVTLEAHLEDLQGRFNLNSLVDENGQLDPEAMRAFESLLESLEIEPKWASLIADWIDADSIPQVPDGAEDSTYAAQNPPYRAPNTLITSTSELLALPEFGRERYLRLAPYITALPRDAKINLCSAQGVLIDSLIEPGHREFGVDPEALAKARESGCYPTVEFFQKTFGGDQAAWQKVQGRVGETSDFFRLTSFVTIGSAEFALYSLLQRDARGQVRVLARTFTPD